MTEGTKKFSPVRITASSEEAAVQQALDLVGAQRDEVEVEVLDQGARGVTVRVSARGASTASSAAPAPTSVASAASAARVEVEAPIAEMPPEPTATPAPLVSVAAAAEPPVTVEPAPAETSEKPAPALVDPALQEKARALAQEFLDRMGMEAQAELAPAPAVSEAGDATRIYLHIDGEDVGILIGKHGQTLQSFQYLLNLTLNNRLPGAESEGALRIMVDAGGYRARRATTLEQMAREAAARAKRDRRAVRLEPMPAHERRLIHMALQGDSAITTGSEGREPMRHVVVSPAGMRPGERGAASGGYGRGGYGGRGNERGGRGGYGGGHGRYGGR